MLRGSTVALGGGGTVRRIDSPQDPALSSALGLHYTGRVTRQIVILSLFVNVSAVYIMHQPYFVVLHLVLQVL
jgi:hypothetical protein